MDLTFTHSKHEIGDIYSLFFTSTSQLDFAAGQSISITLPSGLKHHFAIASAPSEEVIRITTALNWGDFKKELKTLRPSTHVTGWVIKNSFVWQESDLPKIFIAQGLDVAVFRGMLADRLAAGKPLDVTLIYSAPQDELIFKDELEGWLADHPELVIHYHIGKKLDAAFISQHCDIKQSLLYLAGESDATSTLYDALQKHGALEQNIIKAW